MAGEIIWSDDNYFSTRDFSRIINDPGNYCKTCHKLAYPEEMRQFGGTCECEPCPEPFSIELAFSLADTEAEFDEEIKRKPRTVGELLQSLPDIREAHPVEKPKPEPRLSDELLPGVKRQRIHNAFFSVAWVIGGCAVLFFLNPMLAFVMIVAAALTFVALVV